MGFLIGKIPTCSSCHFQDSTVYSTKEITVAEGEIGDEIKLHNSVSGK